MKNKHKIAQKRREWQLQKKLSKISTQSDNSETKTKAQTNNKNGGQDNSSKVKKCTKN